MKIDIAAKTAPLKKTANPTTRDFRLMVLGQVISILGSSLLRFALSLYVLDITGRADIFATLFAISNIPILLSPLGGAIADRFNRRNLMVIYDFTSSAVVLGLLLMMASGSAGVFSIGTVMVLLSVISAMYTPSVTASVPLLVAENRIESANGIVTAVQALSGVAAPILGGFLYAAMGVQALVVMSAAAFFLSAVMEIFIRIPFEKRTQEGPMAATIGRDLKEGFAYVAGQGFIRKALILAALLNFVLTPLFIVGAPIVLKQTLHTTDAMYGVGMGLVQAACILGALSVGLISKHLRVSHMYRWLIAIAALLLPMAIAVAPLAQPGSALSFVLFVAGAFGAAAIINMLSVYLVSKVQKKTPNENLGKVMAIMIGVAQCAAPLGQMVYGVLFQTFLTSVYIPILLVGAAMLALAVLSRLLLRVEDDL